MVNAKPGLVKYKFALTSTPPLLSGQRSPLLDIPRGTLIQQAEITQLLQTSIGSLNIQCTLPAATPRLLTLRRVCHYYSAELPTRCLIKLQFRDRLRIRTHRGRPLIIPGFWSNQLLCIHLHRR